MSDDLNKRAKALLAKALTFLEQRFNQVPCEKCHAVPVSLKDLELAMKLFKDNGILIDPAVTNDALDKVIDSMKLPAAGFPDTKAKDLHVN